MKKHTLVVLVENNPGVLSRLAGHFTRRGYNIQNMVASQTENKDVVHLSISLEADNRAVDLVVSQLKRLVEVIDAFEIKRCERVVRQTMLIRISCPPEKRRDIMDVGTVYGGRVVNVERDSIVLEMTQPPEHLDAAMSAFDFYGVLGYIRTGLIIL